jgi:hypothetical protein
MATKTETKRLSLRRESLRDLNAAELHQVVGGTSGHLQCAGLQPLRMGPSAMNCTSTCAK